MKLVPISLCLFIILFLSSCSNTSKKKKKSRKRKTSLTTTEVAKKFDVDKQILEKFETTTTNESASIKDKANINIDPNIQKSSNIDIKKIKPIAKKEKIEGKEVLPKINELEKKDSAPLEVKSEDLADSPFFLQDQKSKVIWKKLNTQLLQNEKENYDLTYMGIKAGELLLQSNLSNNSINNREVFYFKAIITSDTFYKYIYKVNDVLESYVDKNSFTPLKFSLDQKESNLISTELQLFDIDHNLSYYFYERLNKDGSTKKRQKTVDIPTYFQDPFSVLFMLRALEYQENEKYQIPIMNGVKLLLLDCFLETKEELKIKDKAYKALKVKAQTKYSGDTLKSGDLTFWFSDDQKRKLLKIQMKVSLGNVEVILVN